MYETYSCAFMAEGSYIIWAEFYTYSTNFWLISYFPKLNSTGSHHLAFIQTYWPTISPALIVRLLLIRLGYVVKNQLKG